MLKDLIKSKKFENENWEMTFYSNHSLFSVSQMKNKQKHGTQIIFFDTEHISYIQNFKNDKLNGATISLWIISPMDYFQFFKNDKQEGIKYSTNLIKLYEQNEPFFEYENASQNFYYDGGTYDISYR